MKKVDMKDVTFLIQMRLDSIDRLANLKITVEFLLEHFETNIHILEADQIDVGLIRSVVPSCVSVKFIEDRDPIYYRTLYINKMVNECETPYLSIWEPDIIVPPQQIISSVEWLRSNEADFSSPYEKYALNTTTIIRNMFIRSKDWRIFDTYQKKMKVMYPPNPVGGAFFANTEKYKEIGIDNTNIYGWGIEDGERVRRWLKLGYNYKRVEGNLYHLTHARGLNSNFYAEVDGFIKSKEINRITRMTKQELEKEVATWQDKTPNS